MRVRIDGYDMQREHDKVFRRFPLWQEYFKRTHNKGEIYEECAEAFFGRCCKEEFGE